MGLFSLGRWNRAWKILCRTVPYLRYIESCNYVPYGTRYVLVRWGTARTPLFELVLYSTADLPWPFSPLARSSDNDRIPATNVKLGWRLSQHPQFDDQRPRGDSNNNTCNTTSNNNTAADPLTVRVQTLTDKSLRYRTRQEIGSSTFYLDRSSSTCTGGRKKKT